MKWVDDKMIREMVKGGNVERNLNMRGRVNIECLVFKSAQLIQYGYK